MKTNNILKLEINNKTKHLEKYLRSQWTWKTYTFIFGLLAALVFVVIDLEINFFKLFSDSSKYFGDILGRMLPPDFSNFKTFNKHETPHLSSVKKYCKVYFPKLKYFYCMYCKYCKYWHNLLKYCAYP